MLRLIALLTVLGLLSGALVGCHAEAGGGVGASNVGSAQ